MMDKILIDARAGIIVGLGMISFFCSMYCVLWIWERCTLRYKEDKKPLSEKSEKKVQKEYTIVTPAGEVLYSYVRMTSHQVWKAYFAPYGMEPNKERIQDYMAAGYRIVRVSITVDDDVSDAPNVNITTRARLTKNR